MPGAPKKAAVVGWPIAHSKSPMIHGYWLKKLGIAGNYKRIGLKPDEFVKGIRDLVSSGYAGCNVTLPHKEAALDLSDTATERARAVGAANTLVFKDGKIHADNTDGAGFIRNIQSTCPDWCAQTGPALVLGAGGAARGIIHALHAAGTPEVFVVNRTYEKAKALSEFFGVSLIALPWGDLSKQIPKTYTFINTTSLGMTGQPPLTVDISLLPKTAVVADIVYTPLKTALLQQGDALGLQTVDGLGMLLHQAVPGFEAWFGTRPVVDDALRHCVLDA